MDLNKVIFKGKRIRRSSWKEGSSVFFSENGAVTGSADIMQVWIDDNWEISKTGDEYNTLTKDMLATDWEFSNEKCVLNDDLFFSFGQMAIF